MALRVGDHLAASLVALRAEPTAKRVRALLGGEPAFASTRALLVWEPGRVVPQYAVPASDVVAELSPDAPDAGDRRGPGPVPMGPGGGAVLTPETGFGVHSTPGRVLAVSVGGAHRPGAAFAPDDPDLDGYVIVDFEAFDTWWEEDEQIVGHPRDPYHRVDVRQSSRHVRVSDGGVLLAESRRPALVFETNLPVRHYLPAEDVVAGLTPSDTVTACAYKGVAAYFSTPARPDVAWTYRAPLPDAAQLTGLVAFFGERLDVSVDGVDVPRGRTPWSDPDT